MVIWFFYITIMQTTMHYLWQTKHTNDTRTCNNQWQKSTTKQSQVSIKGRGSWSFKFVKFQSLSLIQWCTAISSRWHNTEPVTECIQKPCSHHQTSSGYLTRHDKWCHCQSIQHWSCDWKLSIQTPNQNILYWFLYRHVYRQFFYGGAEPSLTLPKKRFDSISSCLR